MNRREFITSTVAVTLAGLGDLSAEEIKEVATPPLWPASPVNLGHDALRKMNERRLALHLSESVKLAYFVTMERLHFEPNDWHSQLLMRDAVDRVLIEYKNSRGIYDFKVVCDNSNNPWAVAKTGIIGLDVFWIPNYRRHTHRIRFFPAGYETDFSKAIPNDGQTVDALVLPSA